MLMSCIASCGNPYLGGNGKPTIMPFFSEHLASSMHKCHQINRKFLPDNAKVCSSWSLGKPPVPALTPEPNAIRPLYRLGAH